MLTDEVLKALLEGIIYIAPEPVTLDGILKALEGEDPERIKARLDELVADYEQAAHGIQIRQVANGYKFSTKAEHHEVLRKYVKSLKPLVRLSKPALETLAVIAYRQPVTMPEIEEIRGVDSGGVIHTLLEKKLVVTSGRKNVVGRPILYRTSKDFLVHFGLNNVGELPSLKEFEEMAKRALGSDWAPGEGGAVVEATATPIVEPAAGTPSEADSSQQIPRPATEKAATEEPAAEAAPAPEAAEVPSEARIEVVADSAQNTPAPAPDELGSPEDLAVAPPPDATPPDQRAESSETEPAEASQEVTASPDQPSESSETVPAEPPQSEPDTEPVVDAPVEATPEVVEEPAPVEPREYVEPPPAIVEEPSAVEDHTTEVTEAPVASVEDLAPPAAAAPAAPEEPGTVELPPESHGSEPPTPSAEARAHETPQPTPASEPAANPEESDPKP